MEEEKIEKKNIRTFVRDYWIVAVIAGIILFLYLHSENQIANRTRFTYQGKTTTINWVRGQSYGFSNGKSKEETGEPTGLIFDIFSEDVIGINKKEEKNILTKQPFFELDLSGGQSWVSKQSSIFHPVFYYFAFYDHEGDCYVQMKFSMDRERKSYSSMFRFVNISSKKMKQLLEPRDKIWE